MIKIVLTGPESSGKTMLSKQLAAHFQTNWVPEYARQYIDELGREYQKKDLLEITKGQIELEDQIAFDTKSLLFCDTDLITIKIWSDYKYKKTHPWILQQIKNRSYDLYLLCSPDIPWVDDPQRENSNDRYALFEIYKNTLIAANKNYFVIKGSFEKRYHMAIDEVVRFEDRRPETEDRSSPRT